MTLTLNCTGWNAPPSSVRPVVGPPQAPVIHLKGPRVPQQVANSGPPLEAEPASSTNSAPRLGGKIQEQGLVAEDGERPLIG